MYTPGDPVYNTELVKAIQDDTIVSMCQMGMQHTCMQTSLEITSRALKAVAGDEPTSQNDLCKLRKLGFNSIVAKLVRLNAVTAYTSCGNRYARGKKLPCNLHRTSVVRRLRKLAKVK